MAPSLPTPNAVPVVPPCKRIIAVLSAAATWDSSLCDEINMRFGSIDFRGPFVPFTDDAYYAEEMGAPLWRGWLSLRGLADPADLANWKHAARTLEDLYRRNDKRIYNLDIGYMDADKVVLASFKRGPCKLYFGEDVWADMILGYSQGAFTPTPWAFHDFRDGRYDASLKVIRDKLKAEMRR